MHIPEYLDGFQPPLACSPLIDATGWAADALFWPAFLLQVGMARSAPQAFDVDLADLDVYCQRFEQPDQWPVFTVPIAGGRMHLIVCNLPDDAGIDWLLDADAQDGVRRSDVSEVQYAGAGLPWGLLPEQPTSLLMALPAFGDPDPKEQEQRTVQQALRAVGATWRINELADDLLSHRACMIL
ncbi:hypothetical protein [Actinoplanes sp. L3-i22]|uniref:hypothetical protein n=1 Tax=Actinoplanes sp. L3-i22 TaxID=2836373 RepID=UPI001C752EB6|nr:hypothetical protein [Actinoplanes sp. L3-i22]BCY07003.1 hypothetical protein L3i22_020910 [Actinoplanes sp. L3-i22]